MDRNAVVITWGDPLDPGTAYLTGSCDVMDPEAALSEIRELTAAQTAGHEIDTDRLVDLVTGLDQWLTRSGRLPGQWNQ